jgi:hypothetical protein
MKVYFKKSINSWWVESLLDYYMFKSVNFKTKEEKDYVLSWTRNQDIDDENIVRIYDVEVDDEKYFFMFEQVKDGYLIEAKDSLHLEKLLNDKDIFFVGDTLD